jgi:hypothetical protein
MKKLTRILCTALSSVACVATAADRTVSANWTLTQDETIDGSLIVPSGVTVDLNGHRLTAKGLHSGSAPILTDGDSVQYEQLEYVITTGEQYVPTTYTPANTDRAEILVEFSDNSNGFLFSTRDKDYRNSFSCFRKSNTVTRFDLSETQKDLSISTTVNGNRYYVVINANDPVGGSTGTGFVRANEASSTSFGYVSISKGTFAPNGPFVLFAASHWVNGVLEPGSTAYPGKCKFYHFKVTNGDAVKCNIVPAKRVSDGVVGLFDTVAGNFLLARLADNTQAVTSFAQYGEMEAEGGTVTSDNFSHAADLTVNEPARVSCNYTSFASGAYAASVLFNNNYTRQGDTSHRILLNLNAGYDSLPFAVDYDFGDGTQQIVNAYKLWFGTAGTAYAGRAPKAWKFYGSNDKDNNDWKLLDERTSETGWDYNNKARTYSFANDVPYRWYRLEITATNGGDNFMELTQIEYFRTGCLCIDVPDGTSTTNSAISITGGIVVEKDGPGTLSMAKRNDGFGGAGVTTLVVKNGKVTRTPNKILATCGAAKSTISVLDGGQFDLAGFNYYDYKYTIAGDGPDGRGALVNDVLAAGHQNQGTWYADIWHGFLGDVTLADDATIGGSETFGMLYFAAAVGGSYAASAMTMNGHTLTYAMPLPKTIYSWGMYDYNGKGRIVIAEGCQFAFTMGDANRPTSARNCELIVAGTLNQNNQGATVKSLSFTATGIYTHATVKPITVYEEYAPNINSTENKNKHPTVTLGASGHTNTVLNLSLFSDTFDSTFTTFYSGSTVTVDTGARALAGGTKLVAWSSPPTNVSFVLKDAETLLFEVFTTDNGLYVRSTATPAYAIWDFDAETWKFFTSDDVDITQEWTQGVTSLMQVRFNSLAEYAVLTNASSGMTPAGYVLTGLTLETGTDEIDLTGIDFVLAEGATLNLKGNTVKIPCSALSAFNESTITDSTSLGGKLVLDVPAGATVENAYVTLSGSLRFVKQGEGTFIPTKLYQTYTGGNEIAKGTLKLSTAHNEYDGYFNELGGFVEGSGAYADVEILPGATVDQNGQVGLRSYNFILKGGTLTNTRTDFGTNKALFFRIALRDAERSYFASSTGISTGFYADLDGATTLDLGGKTLELGIPGSKFFYLNNTTISNGTLDVVSGGSLRTMHKPSDARTAIINLNAALYLEQALSVSNIVIKYNGDWDQGTGALNVYGTFRPETAGGYFYGPTMQDGSTLDLSAWNVDDLGFPVYSRSARYSISTNITFAADAKKIGVKLNPNSERTKTLARDKSNPCYLLRWSEENAPDASMKFELDAESSRFFRLRRKDDGLVLDFNRGLVIYVR